MLKANVFIKIDGEYKNLDQIKTKELTRIATELNTRALAEVKYKRIERAS